MVPFFGETKKGTAPPGAHPGQRRIQRRKPLTPTLHDPEGAYPEIPRWEEIAKRNRLTLQRLTELVAPHLLH